jgi:molybdopterin-guanine dinucleotide biosynthesis adapter protein
MNRPIRGNYRGRARAGSSAVAKPAATTHLAAMRVMGLAGWSGSGKTTLLVRLIPELRARGLRVSTVKHAHHEFDVDRPGKDSFEHRRAGAVEVLVSSASRWALMHEHRGDAEPGLAELLGRMSPVDLVLVEGFKRDRHPKLEVHRPSVGKPLLCLDDRMIRGVASDVALENLSVPRLPLDDIPGIAAFVLAHAEEWPD